MAIIYLQSSDGELFPIDVEIAKCSGTIRAMLDEAGMEAEGVVPLPIVSAVILRLVLQWIKANHQKDDPIPAADDENNAKHDRTDDTPFWDDETVNVDQVTLFELISAAKFLEIKGLLHITCKTVAKMIQDKTPGEIRSTFDFPNDLFPKQKEATIISDIQLKNRTQRLGHNCSICVCFSKIVSRLLILFAFFRTCVRFSKYVWDSRNSCQQNGVPQEESSLSSDKEAAVMKVPVDDWEDIFDYIDRKDLNSMANTCKRMQMIAGWYFNKYYPNTYADLNGDDIMFGNTVVNGFREYVSKLNLFYPTPEDFRFIKANNFKSLKELTLISGHFTSADTGAIKAILGNIECVRLISCTFEGDFYEIFLKWCVKLRSLVIQYTKFPIGNNNDWLLQKYPTLERIRLDEGYSSKPIVELKTFFEQNPNVKTLELNGLFNTHIELLMNTNCKLETFKLTNHGDGSSLNELRPRIESLHERGFYKRFELISVPMARLSEVCSIPGLEAVEIAHFNRFVELESPINTRMVQFQLPKESSNETYIEFESFIRNLANVRKLSFSSVYIGANKIQNYLQVILRHSPTVREIECAISEGGCLDMAALNAEREKLAGARKVMFLFNDKVFLATKRKFGDKEFRLVEFKRGIF